MTTTPKRGATETIVVMTAAGRPQSEVAAAAGVSIRTLRRRQREPAIIAAVAAAVAQGEQEALGRFSLLRSRVFDQLDVLLDHEDPGVVLRTSRLVLETGLAHRAAIANDTLTSLETAVAASLTTARTLGGVA